MLKDLTEKIGSDLSKRWRDGRVKLDRFHACTPRIDEPSPTCNQLSAAIRSSNGDRYGIGERLPIVCDRARPHINRWRERERAIDTKRVDRPLILERRSWIGRRTSMDGIGPIPRPKFSIEPRSNKVRFRGWLREDGGRGRRIARNGDCRERGNQRRRPRFATNNLWLKLFRSPSPPADTPWPTTSAVTRGPRFQSRTADVLVLVLLVFGTGEGGHSRGDFVSFSVKKSRYPINPRGK